MLELMKIPLLASIFVSAQAITALRSRSVDDGSNPVTKVVKLLEEMKATAESEAKEDEEIYSKMGCWCKTNDKEKTEAIKIAESRIESLTATIETGTANAGELKTMISGLKDEIADGQQALDEAMAMREKEKTDFEEEDADLKESSGLLKEALEVLAKVQLMQHKQSSTSANHEREAKALLQVRDLVTRASNPSKVSGGAYFSTMQKDLWDFFGALPAKGNTAEHPPVITGLSQQGQPAGAAAGSKSYSSRSSSIFGLLEEMKSTVDKDLAAAHKAEITAEIGFQKLRSTKEGEIQAASKSVEEKTVELADTNQKVAQAKEDIEDTKDALSADEKFLMDLKARCKTAAEDFDARSKTRQEEIIAIGEAIGILTGDDARDLISKTVSLVQRQVRHQTQQVHAHASKSSELSSRQHAASELLQVAKQHSGSSGGMRLALLAVSAQLDGFEKVKEMMDKMVVELKNQQKAEYEKHEACKKDIDTNEDATMEKDAEKKDLDAKITDLTGRLEALTNELAELAGQVKEAHVALKQAGETRKKENHEFQQVVSDQRATITILNKALDRLKAFYSEKSFLALGSRQGKQEPGAAAPPPPPAGKAYKKSGMAGGVLQMLAKIIQEAETADKEAVASEQHSQEEYSTFVANTNEMLDTYQKSIAGKTEAKEKSTADKLVAGQDLAAVATSIEDLKNENKGLHLGCDYLLKNYDIRQTARQEEISSIQEAKAILSGADFGF